MKLTSIQAIYNLGLAQLPHHPFPQSSPKPAFSISNQPTCPASPVLLAAQKQGPGKTICGYSFFMPHNILRVKLCTVEMTQINRFLQNSHLPTLQRQIALYSPCQSLLSVVMFSTPIKPSNKIRNLTYYIFRERL